MPDPENVDQGPSDELMSLDEFLDNQTEGLSDLAEEEIENLDEEAAEQMQQLKGKLSDILEEDSDAALRKALDESKDADSPDVDYKVSRENELIRIRLFLKAIALRLDDIHSALTG